MQGRASHVVASRARGSNGGHALCMEATPWTRAAHWGILPSTWRAAKRSAWGTILGRLQAKFGHGPKMKFAHLGLLYISY